MTKRHPLSVILVTPMTCNAERQRKWRASQLELGRKPYSAMLTEDERFFVQRLVEQMRRDGVVPAFMRDKAGRLVPADV